MTWPTKRLGSEAAVTVDASQFLPAFQLRQWHEELDALGMRSTGSPVHEHYIDLLIDRLKAVGVSQVHAEPVALKKWTAKRWALELGGSGERVATASYIPYSGRRPEKASRVPSPTSERERRLPPAPSRGRSRSSRCRAPRSPTAPWRRSPTASTTLKACSSPRKNIRDRGAGSAT